MPAAIDGKAVRFRRENLPGAPSQRIFAKKIGISYVTLSDIETGKSSGSTRMIERIARGLGCAPRDITRADVAGDSIEREGPALDLRDTSTEMSTWMNVPIMGRAPAGTPSEAFENFLGFYPAPAALVRGDPKAYVCIRAVGTSMIDMQIRDGDTMLLHLQEEASDGDIVVARIEGEGVTCKIFRLKKGVPFLEAANPEHKPLPRKPFRIVGKVIWRGG